MPDEPRLVAGNLDCEANWSGASLPRPLRQMLSAAATLMRVLAEQGDMLWTPEPVDPARMAGDLPHPALRSGPPPACSALLAWGETAATARHRPAPPPRIPGLPGTLWSVPPPPPDIAARVNDRTFGLALARELGCALPGSRIVASSAELVDAAGDRPWVCKPLLSAAGRGLLIGRGRPTLEQLPAPMLYEPWLDRTADFGCCAILLRDTTLQLPPHRLLVTERGGFRGVALPAVLNDADAALLERTVEATGVALRAAGYLGPFTVDAWRHAGGFHPLGEINARCSFGLLLHALVERLGLVGQVVLGLGRNPPAGATLLLAPGPPDGLGAWIERD